MKLNLTFSLLWVSFLLFAQSETSVQQLYEAGEVILSKQPLRAFDRLQALDKFQQCYKEIEENGITNEELKSQSSEAIQTLLTYFSQFQDADSLLELTRFYPDSVFQANRRYTEEFKTLIQDYLNIKNSVCRKSFLKLRHLNHANALIRPNTSFTVNFSDYWPLEVREFDNWLSQNEKSLNAASQQFKTELLYRRLQFLRDSLQNQESNTYYQSNTNHLLDKLKTAQETTEATTLQFRRFKQIGLGILALLSLVGYFIWRRNIQLLKSRNQTLLEEKRKSDALLTNILPTEVVRQLRSKELTKAKKYNSVCVLFSDFKNFSQISKNVPPEELVRELDYCFSAFDQIIDKYRLQKIKTIGDAYMCVGGLYTKGDHHIPRMVAAALEIQQFLNGRKIQRTSIRSYFFEARIGIHTGPVVAGIIGTNKYAFDVWGDTVNVAQQMEQHSEVGRVNISGETYELVKDKYKCAHRGTITVKNNKEYKMYFVEERSSTGILT